MSDDAVLESILCIHQPHYISPIIDKYVKHPKFQGQAWHQDEIYIPTRDRSLIGAWIAMDDANVENGCLRVLPSSHRRGYLYPQQPHNKPNEFDSADESYGFNTSGEIPVEVKVGTLVFFNGYLLHRSLQNLGNTYRRVLVNHYCNAWSLLPWSVKEGERSANTDRRCIIPVAGIDPYAWKGYESHPELLHVRSCKAAEEARVALQQRGGSNTDGH